MWEFPQQRKTNNFSVASPFCCRRPLRPEGIFWTVVGLIYQLCGGSPCQPVSCTFNLVSNGNHQLKRLISFHIPHLCLSLCPSVCRSVSLSLFRAHTGAHIPLYMCFNIYIVRRCQNVPTYKSPKNCWANILFCINLRLDTHKKLMTCRFLFSILEKTYKIQVSTGVD